jgi:hypothetical protein
MAQIIDLRVSVDANAPPTSAYWDIKADFCEKNGFGLMLMSDCNSSLYEHSRPDVFRNTAGTLFDIDGLSGITPIDSAVITVKSWRYGMQSSGRYMNPKNEGVLYIDVETAGVKINGHTFMRKLSFKLFVTGGHNEQSSLSTLASVMSEKLSEALSRHLSNGLEVAS